MSGAADPADDFVGTLLDVLRMHVHGIDEEAMRQIEEQIRADYGGDRIYIARVGWYDRGERDRAIRADHRAGRSLRWLAARYCLGKSTVQAIVREADAGAVRDGV